MVQTWGSWILPEFFFGVLGPACPRFPTALSEPEAQQFGGEPSRGSGVLIRLGQQLQRLFTQQMFEEQPESQAQFAQSEMIRDDQRTPKYPWNSKISKTK
jgi:hypothetical protein